MRRKLTLKWIAAIAPVVVLLAGGIRAQEAGPETTKQAQAILEKNCTPCHGSAKGVNVLRLESLLATKVVVPGKPDASKLLQVIKDGSMPLGGSKLPDAEIRTLEAWVKAGAPDWTQARAAGGQGPKARATVTESALLKAIVQDLQAANERDRPFLRYYSLANIANNPDVPDKRLALYRGALSKLVNHLSWNQEIVKPHAVNESETLLRIDLRDFDWTPDIWKRIIAAYPYGVRTRGLEGELRQIEALSGVELPYIRVDWFVANASVPPLYHEILQLPDTLAGLEQKLNIHSDDDVAQDKVVRGGVRNSGVSHNNRVIERHRSANGAYWKSFDFASNQAEKNIFLDPLNFHEDGGEFIFNLPNGLQGYMIANAKGARLDDAPIKIVRDRFTNPDDPVVHNGLSCIGCHTQGMNRMQNEVRQMLETQQKTAFDLDKALKLYAPQEDLDRSFQQDEERFARAVLATGTAVPKQPADEPVNMLAQLYLADLSVAQAAADAGLSVEELRKRLGKSTELDRLGFGQLLTANGGMKRDAWEQYFGDLVEDIRLGDYLKPTQPRGKGHNEAQAIRRTVRIVRFTGPDARGAEQDLAFWLGHSDDLQVIGSTADVNLTGTITPVGQDKITLVARDTATGLSEEASGVSTDLHFLTQQLADKVAFRLTGERLALNAAQAARQPVAAAVPADPALALQQAFGNGGPVHIFLSIDKGPGQIYRANEAVSVRFKVDRDCFLQIKNIDSAGNVVNLFPNEHQPDGHVVAGQVYELTDRSGKTIISVDPDGVFGRETIIAFATLEESDLPAARSKTLKVDGSGAGNFSQQVQKVARGGRISSVSLQFFTQK
jgi:mono/diheme cytochrome c family protein